MIQRCRDFAQNECLPGVIDRDDKMHFPREQLEKLADLGFLGMMIVPTMAALFRYYQLRAGNGRDQQDRFKC
jgi:alkylation response protein AidB-like acyl-CoA dehydrogenase